MNEAFFKHAMERIATITDDEMQDVMAKNGVGFSTKPKPDQPDVFAGNRVLTFTSDDLPSDLRRTITELLIGQIGALWFELGMDWESTGDKQGKSILKIQVHDESAEVLIRLVLPEDIKIKSEPYVH